MTSGDPIAFAQTGKVEFSDRFFNSAIPLVPDRRDSTSWARLKELEEEMAALTGKIAMLERDKDDMEEALARLMRAIPVASDPTEAEMMEMLHRTGTFDEIYRHMEKKAMDPDLTFEDAKRAIEEFSEFSVAISSYLKRRIPPPGALIPVDPVHDAKEEWR